MWTEIQLVRLNRLIIPTDQFAIYTSTAEELNQGLAETNPVGGQGGTWTQDNQIWSLMPQPLSHAASLLARSVQILLR